MGVIVVYTNNQIAWHRRRVLDFFRKGLLQDSNPELVLFLVDCMLQNR